MIGTARALLGQRIRQARTDRGWRQSDLAAAMTDEASRRIGDMAREKAIASVYSVGKIRAALTALHKAGAPLDKLDRLNGEETVRAAAIAEFCLAATSRRRPVDGHAIVWTTKEAQ